MKTLIISDTHLYHVFDKRKFFLLKKLFSSVDQVILNGDFWDGYRTRQYQSRPLGRYAAALKPLPAIPLALPNHLPGEYSSSRQN